MSIVVSPLTETYKKKTQNLMDENFPCRMLNRARPRRRDHVARRLRNSFIIMKPVGPGRMRSTRVSCTPLTWQLQLGLSDVTARRSGWQQPHLSDIALDGLIPCTFFMFFGRVHILRRLPCASVFIEASR